MQRYVFIAGPLSPVRNTDLSFSPQRVLFSFLLLNNHLVGLVVKASASRAEDPGFESRLRRDFFRGRVIPMTQKMVLQYRVKRLELGSMLGLVGSVSVYCDWVKWKVQFLSQCGST